MKFGTYIHTYIISYYHNYYNKATAFVCMLLKISESTEQIPLVFLRKI